MKPVIEALMKLLEQLDELRERAGNKKQFEYEIDWRLNKLKRKWRGES